MTKKALLLVDIQQDYFPDGAFPLPNMEDSTHNASTLLTWARKSEIKIIHIRHEETDPDAEFLASGSAGAQINNLVLPIDGETIITKHYPNSFRGTALSEAIDGIDEVLIVGAMSNMCIDATARAAFDCGLTVSVIHDACAASSLEFQRNELPAEVVHGAFMSALASADGRVVSTKEIVGAANELGAICA